MAAPVVQAMGLRSLLHLAFLGLGSIGPLVRGPNFRVLAVGVEEQEVIQIPGNGSAPLLVSAHVFVSNVFNVDILRYTVSYVLMLRLAWLDARLAWNATMYPRQVVTLPTNLLWTPGLSIREALWTDWKDENPQATVGQDGHVEVNLALTTEANCDFELLHFPRDQSSCNLSFFVFSNSVQELEFQVQVTNEIVSIKREYVVEAVETQVLKEQLVPCFQVTLSLRNTALKSIIALIVPGEGLLLADVCGGLLPLQAFERMAYKVTLLLGYLVFHSSLVQGLPSSSSCNPLLTYFFTVLLLLLLLSTVETVLLAGMLARDTLRAGHSPSPAPEPDPKDPRRGGEGSRRNWLEAADHVFLLVYVASVLCTQVIFVAIWIWATCKSDPPPGMDGPHGGQPSMWQGGLKQLTSGQGVGS